MKWGDIRKKKTDVLGFFWKGNNFSVEGLVKNMSYDSNKVVYDRMDHFTVDEIAAFQQIASIESLYMDQ